MRLVDAARCFFGGHRYADQNLECKLLRHDGRVGVFEMRNRCVHCGKEYREEVQIPMRVETNLFDVEEIHTNCTVQILTNSATGETSVGWWENERDD